NSAGCGREPIETCARTRDADAKRANSRRMSMCLILSISIPRVLINQTHKRTRTGRRTNTGVGPRKPQLIRLPGESNEAKVSALIALVKPGRCIAPAALSTDYPHTVRSRGLSSRPSGLFRAFDTFQDVGKLEPKVARQMI